MVYGVSAVDVALSLLANVIVPLAASKESFADYRTVLLYAGYAGFSHLGLLSGIYLTVVGKRDDQLDWQLLRTVKTVLLATQALLLLLLVVAYATWFGGATSSWLGLVS